MAAFTAYPPVPAQAQKNIEAWPAPVVTRLLLYFANLAENMCGRVSAREQAQLSGVQAARDGERYYESFHRLSLGEKPVREASDLRLCKSALFREDEVAGFSADDKDEWCNQAPRR